MDKYVELSRLPPSNEYCCLNLFTGEKNSYSGNKKIAGKFTGWYFDDKKTFFACYPTKNEWKIWYKGKEYSLTKNLTINLDIKGENRLFSIKEYDIEIHYIKSEHTPVIWLDEDDFDLFLKIYINHKKEKFYTRLKELESERQKLKIPDDWWK